MTDYIEFTAVQNDRAEFDAARGIGGPAWTRTRDQGIHFTQSFLIGVDYLITLNRVVRGGTLVPVIKNTEVLR